MNLNNKHIVITGATGGIGKALASRLDELGASLYLVGRNKTALSDLKQSLTHTQRTFTADLNNTADRNAFTNAVKSSLVESKNDLDIMINLAGVSCFSLLEDTSDDDLDRLIETNLLTPIKLTRDLSPLMSPDGSRIINVGSTLGAIGYPGYSAYCASKFGLRGFTEALRRELADSDIKVQYIAPRATRTALNSDAVNQMNEALGNQTDSAETVASEIINLIRKNKTEINIGWPEKLFIQLNAVCNSLVSKAINTNLTQIKTFAREN